MNTKPFAENYDYQHEAASHAHAYLWPLVFSTLDRLPQRRVFDLGCGNGATAAALAARGWDVAGVDPSESGVMVANRAFPRLQIERGSSDDDLAGRFGRFPTVISLEVVEHVYAPRRFATCVYELLEPGGTAVLSTPYHGYLKNLALAVTGQMDRHFTALWDNGHIKFWSWQTLSALLTEAGFIDIAFAGVGRFPLLWKSMVLTARRPKQSESLVQKSG